MAELPDILSSSEMGDVVAALAALRKKYMPSSGDEGHWPVATALVGRYRPDKVLQILLSETPRYPGYKEVLAASFAGWLIAPRYPKLRQDLMVRAALDHMQRAEVTAGVVRDLPLTLEKDVAARYLFTGIEFLIEVYDCLGGYNAFSEAPSLDELWDGLEGVEKTINTAARAIAFLHHAVDRSARPGFTPSLNKAVTVFDALKDAKEYPYKDRYVSRSLLHQRWSQNKQTLALVYAASTIRVNRKTLLDQILAGFFSYEHHRQHLELWVARARYVATHIFARMVDPDLERATTAVVGEGPIKPFTPAKLMGAELVSFTKTFSSIIKR
jgi:hypothetical protein